MANASTGTFGADSGVGSTVALLKEQLPAVRERRRLLEEQLAALIAQESAMVSALEGLAALTGIPVGRHHKDTAAAEHTAAEIQAQAETEPVGPGAAATPSGAGEQAAADTAPEAETAAAQPARGRTSARKAPAGRKSSPAAVADDAATPDPAPAPVRKAATRKAPITAPGGKTAAKTTAGPTPEQDTAPAIATTAPAAARGKAAAARAATGGAAKKATKPVTGAVGNASAPDAKPAKKTARRAAVAAGEVSAPAADTTRTTAEKSAGGKAAKSATSAPAARRKAVAVPAQAGPADSTAPGATAQGRRTGSDRRQGLTDAAGVLAVLSAATAPLRAREVATTLGLDDLESNVNAVRTRLERLAKAGQAQRTGRGLYAATATAVAAG
ncbi:hypothetical protein AB0D08_37515 [Kitasatospora sp. NPDC048540]|uniref:hypothetical protein n=1 Tax=Kitasatospora sp. NPDC048540 TaxID=3155634 RepID=UPI0033EAA23D